jgi:hypothetical protein
MNFTMEEEPEAVEADEEDEEGTLPLQKKSFDAEVRLFAPTDFDDQAEGSDEESAEIPKIYVQIQRNRGDIVAFGNFVKDLMEEGKLKVFVEKSE